MPERDPGLYEYYNEYASLHSYYSIGYGLQITISIYNALAAVR